MLNFPLLDLFCANAEYKEDDFANYLQQHHLPRIFAPYVKRHVGEMQTSKMQSLLADYQTPDSFSEDVCNRAFLTAYLGEHQLLDWDGIIVRMLILDLPSDEKKRNDYYYKMQHNSDACHALQNKLTSLFGIGYEPNQPHRMRKIAESLKYNTLTQLFDSAPHDTYKTYKIIEAMQIEQINKLYDLRCLRSS